MATINAFNVVDGVDGLAGSLAHVSLAALALVGFIGGGDIALAVIACASIFGFMLFNVPTKQNRRVRAFMGDAGSTMLGLIVVWATIDISQGESRLAGLGLAGLYSGVPDVIMFVAWAISGLTMQKVLHAKPGDLFAHSYLP